MLCNINFMFLSSEVLWVPPAKLKSFCQLDMRKWPMDIHNCTLKFASWTAHGGQIDLMLYQNSKQVSYMSLDKVLKIFWNKIIVCTDRGLCYLVWICNVNELHISMPDKHFLAHASLSQMFPCIYIG